MIKPLLVMFAGPNGSGKSSVTPIFQNQPGFPERYINPDEIALTLGGDIMSKAYQASAIAAQQRLECIEQQQSFAFETVMSHPSKLAILETAKAAGFETRVVFVSTENPELNIDRVKQRVAAGGHDVPENKIKSRYHRSLSLLPKALEIADRTHLVDNSDLVQIKAVLSQGQIIEKASEKSQWIENTLDALDQRQQEILAIEQDNPNSFFARLDRGEHSGEIKTVGKHFTTQHVQDGQIIIHDNAILNLNRSAIGRNLSILYDQGVHQAQSATRS